MLLAVLFAAALSTETPPPADPEDRAVLAVTQAFFDGMAAGSPEALRAVTLPGAQLTSVRPQPDGTSKISRTAFEDSFGKAVPPGLKEWMWSTLIVRHTNLATVTGPFELTKDGKTVHCGMQVFTLVKTGGVTPESAWKVASISWTAEPDACPELRKL
ncbi:hypothetical protein [Caulobacter sp.]|uniref:hypothetical protein n=1 Tax=Caulobacter sp. TaxID=78 RepID=UPI00161458DA